MNLIDRYVYAVGKYLPNDIRMDVLKELRTNIEDMLPENYTERDVYNILEELGSPLKLASEYNAGKRYLIGPGYFENYLAILKMVIGICIAVSVSIPIITFIVNPPEIDLMNNIIRLFINMITGVLAGGVQGTFWVTLIFVILERSGAEAGDLPFYSEKWTPDSLPEIPVNDHMKISRGETVFSMICTIAFTALLYLNPQLIAIYSKGENNVVNTAALFNITRLKVYMIFIFALAIFQLGVFVWKYITERWNKPLIIFNTLNNVLVCILAVAMIRDSELINAEFIPTIADLTNGSIETIAIWLDRGKRIFVGFFVATCAWDSIAIFYKYWLKGKERI